MWNLIGIYPLLCLTFDVLKCCWNPLLFNSKRCSFVYISNHHYSWCYTQHGFVPFHWEAKANAKSKDALVNFLCLFQAQRNLFDVIQSKQRATATAFFLILKNIFYQFYWQLAYFSSSGFWVKFFLAKRYNTFITTSGWKLQWGLLVMSPNPRSKSLTILCYEYKMCSRLFN